MKTSYLGVKIILFTLILLLGGMLLWQIRTFRYVLGLPVVITHVIKPDSKTHEELNDTDSVKIFLGTFLGNEKRNFYGDSIPDSLQIIWKYEIGGAETNPTGREVEKWYGAGWTGQPLIVLENNHPYLIQGCYDHTLKKIDVVTGLLVWEYKYDDVLKGTGTIWKDPSAKNPLDRFVIIQGARIGLKNNLRSDTIPSLRAISYFTGKELWRMNVKKGPSFSRDVDGSALILKDTVYMGLENGLFTVYTPGPDNYISAGNLHFKNTLEEHPLYEAGDRLKHGGELVIESSPCRLRDHVYITTGAGHLYGYNLFTRMVDWDLYLGCDMNGSPVVTSDSCLIITLEKQFIPGQGGAMKIDPSKPANESVVWFLPTGNRKFAGWDGGIVGSVSVNDGYKNKYSRKLACISALDGNLYLVDHQKLNDTLKVKGPNGEKEFPTPRVLSIAEIGPTISTPIFVKDRICAAGYSGIKIFDIEGNYELVEKAWFPGIFEATPTAFGGKIFIASKNGFLYCLGKIHATDNLTMQDPAQ